MALVRLQEHAAPSRGEQASRRSVNVVPRRAAHRARCCSLFLCDNARGWSRVCGGGGTARLPWTTRPRLRSRDRATLRFSSSECSICRHESEEAPRAHRRRRPPPSFLRRAAPSFVHAPSRARRKRDVLVLLPMTGDRAKRIERARASLGLSRTDGRCVGDARGAARRLVLRRGVLADGSIDRSIDRLRVLVHDRGRHLHPLPVLRGPGGAHVGDPEAPGLHNHHRFFGDFYLCVYAPSTVPTLCERLPRFPVVSMLRPTTPSQHRRATRRSRF